MKKDQTFRNNATRETLTMLVGDEENNGACQLYEVFLPPHRPSPPLHYHVDFTETFTVKQGKLDFYVDRDQNTSCFSREKAQRQRSGSRIDLPMSMMSRSFSQSKRSLRGVS